MSREEKLEILLKLLEQHSWVRTDRRDGIWTVAQPYTIFILTGPGQIRLEVKDNNHLIEEIEFWWPSDDRLSTRPSKHAKLLYDFYLEQFGKIREQEERAKIRRTQQWEEYLRRHTWRTDQSD